MRSLATDLTVEHRTVKFGFEESSHLSEAHQTCVLHVRPEVWRNSWSDLQEILWTHFHFCYVPLMQDWRRADASCSEPGQVTSPWTCPGWPSADAPQDEEWFWDWMPRCLTGWWRLEMEFVCRGWPHFKDKKNKMSVNFWTIWDTFLPYHNLTVSPVSSTWSSVSEPILDPRPQTKNCGSPSGAGSRALTVKPSQFKHYGCHRPAQDGDAQGLLSFC